ncbi:substrate-binding domain-containing protein [Mycetocola sp.]
MAPDALFCAFDGLAVPVLRELASRGVRVPSDIAVPASTTNVQRFF